MKLFCLGHDFNYEMENLCRLFFPDEKITVLKTEENTDENNEINIVTNHSDNKLYVKVNTFNGVSYEAENADIPTDEREIERELAVLLFKLLVKVTGFTPKWGILTGVRPVKLFRNLVNSGGVVYAADYFRDKLLVSQDKLSLAAETCGREGAIIDRSLYKGFSLYISIPFCPTRCSYCSFVSQSIEHAGKLIESYVELLVKEIEFTGEIAKNAGLTLQTVYIGGGTPTTLSAEQLKIVINAVYNSFDTSHLEEFTVEAGRPDTITKEKLIALKSSGIERISINPQTFNDSVLETIGRRHTSAQTEEAMLLAKSIGFGNINMDIIAGLPTDTLESFNNTLERCFYFDPQSITVHTLSIKRASRLVYSGEAEYNSEGILVSKMVDNSISELFKRDYRPYYLYRQTRMLGNLENTGWSKEGCEGLYNVFIMDETHTILACGAGAVTKMRQPGGSYIERIFNYKFPYEYINGFDEMLKRKKSVVEFYEKFS